MHVRIEKRLLHGALSAQALASRSSRVCFHASRLDLQPATRPSEIVRSRSISQRKPFCIAGMPWYLASERAGTCASARLPSRSWPGRRTTPTASSAQAATPPLEAAHHLPPLLGMWEPLLSGSPGRQSGPMLLTVTQWPSPKCARTDVGTVSPSCRSTRPWASAPVAKVAEPSPAPWRCSPRLFGSGRPESSPRPRASRTLRPPPSAGV